MAILTDKQIAGLARAAGFPPDQIGTAVAIALAESGGRTDALNTANRNGSWDAGVWQINSVHGYSQQSLFDPKFNAAAAFKIWSAAGRKWTPWSTYNSGRYLVYKSRGAIAAQNPDIVGGVPNVPGQNGSGLPLGITDDPRNPFAGIGTTGILKDATLGGFWLRLGVFILGAWLFILGLMRMAGVGGTIVKFTKAAARAKGVPI